MNFYSNFHSWVILVHYGWLFLKYLSNRQNYVEIKGYRLNLFPVRSGVLHGSVLGPLLFLNYVNALCSFSSVYMFADDTMLVTLLESCANSNGFQSDLDNLSERCREWQLKLNASKCTSLSISTSHWSNYYCTDSDTIQSISQQRDLGVTVSDTLNWSIHIRLVSGKAYHTLHLIKHSIFHWNHQHLSRRVSFCHSWDQDLQTVHNSGVLLSLKILLS